MDIIKNPAIRYTLIAIVVFYIFGAISQLTEDIRTLFANPIFSILLLVGIVQLSYHDLPLAFLLGIALIISISMSNYVTINKLLGNEQYPSGVEWNDPTFGDQPVGYNVDKFCDNNWEFQCEGVNTFGRELNTQGMNPVQGYAHNPDYSSADF